MKDTVLTQETKNLVREQLELTDLLDNASKKYYRGEESGLSDVEFDLKLKELQRIERESGVVLPNSPTQRVGSDVQDGFKKIQHPIPMLTIENTYKAEELEEWLNKQTALTYEISTKFDGVSLEIHYHDGMMVSASTRGDKNIGDDVTANARTIKDIPLSLSGNPEFYQDKDIYIRGEVLMLRSVFNSINEELESLGQKPLANCRNAASGSIKQLDSHITAMRQLAFRPWDILVSVGGEMRPDLTNCDLRTFDLGIVFNHLGFYTEDFARPVYVNKDEVIAAVDEYKKRLDESDTDFDYDGVVVKVLSQEERMKTVDHRAIEWGIARKWNEERAAFAILDSVSWQVGRTGVVTPVANFVPFELDGVEVSNATLHNLSFIEKNNLTTGQHVKVVRSGGVIPYVERVMTKDDYDKAGIKFWMMPAYKIEYPTVCPVCGTSLIREGDFLKCPNEKCTGRLLEAIEYWCSKKVMDIRDIGPEFIRDLIEKQMVTCPIDLYLLEKNYTVKDMIDILGKGYGQTSVKKKLRAIKESLKQPAYRVLAGTGIPGIGPRMAKILLSEFGSIAGIFSKSEEELKQVAGIGDVLAKNIADYALNTGWQFLSDCYELNLNTKTEDSEEQTVSQHEQLLEGMKIVFSGASKYFPGDSVEEFLESYGAKCGHSISRKTTCLVTGDNPGPKKVQTCKDLGIMMMTEDEFYKKYNLDVQSGS